jgi:hypothetical protein
VFDRRRLAEPEQVQAPQARFFLSHPAPLAALKRIPSHILGNLFVVTRDAEEHARVSRMRIDVVQDRSDDPMNAQVVQ